MGNFSHDANYLSVYPTSSTSLRLYWDPIAGAEGYKIYRSQVPGQASVATQEIASVPSNTNIYDDFDLPENVVEFYVVRPVINNEVLTPSEESGHFPNSSGIPWNGSAENIVAKARELLQADPDNWDDDTLDSTPVYVMSPDGKVYEEGNPIVKTSDATIDPVSETMNIGGVESAVSPDFFGDNSTEQDSGNFLMSGLNQQNLFASSTGTGGIDKNALGGIRRVRSIKTSSIGGTPVRVIGVEGVFQLLWAF